MTLAVWNGTAADESSGDLRVLVSPTVTVTDKWTGANATLFTDRSGGTGKSNPFTAGADGSITFGVAPGRYKIVADDGAGNTATWDDELIGTGFIEPVHATDGGTDAYTSARGSTPPDGDIIVRDFQSQNTTTTPTLDGFTITDRDGNALWPGALNGLHDLQYDTSTSPDTYLCLNPNPTAAHPEHATASGSPADDYESATNTSAPGDGVTITRDFQSANTTTTPTLDARTITDIAGNALWAGALNRVHDLLDDGTNYRVVNPIPNTGLSLDLEVFTAGHIDGLELSNNGTDADHDIDISTGVCSMRDGSGNRKLFELTSGLTKQIDANWAEGDDAGGFPSGLTLSADTDYIFFLVGKDDGTVDAGFDTSATASNLLTDASDYSWFRRIGSVVTDGSSNILGFTQKDDEFLLDTPVNDYDAQDPGTSAVLRALTCPAEQTAIHVYQSFDSGSTRLIAALITSPDQTDTAPSSTVFSVRTQDGTNNRTAHVLVLVRTNSSSQVRTRVETSDTGVRQRGVTFGWIDDRGRNQ